MPTCRSRGGSLSRASDTVHLFHWSITRLSYIYDAFQLWLRGFCIEQFGWSRKRGFELPQGLRPNLEYADDICCLSTMHDQFYTDWITWQFRDPNKAFSLHLQSAPYAFKADRSVCLQIVRFDRFELSINIKYLRSLLQLMLGRKYRHQKRKPKLLSRICDTCDASMAYGFLLREGLGHQALPHSEVSETFRI